MKKIDKLIHNVENNKELTNKMKSFNYYDAERFVEDALRYIKAIKESRMICSIGSVSASGMSRTIKFVSIEKNKYKNSGALHYTSNYFQFFKALGYTESRSKEHYFQIGGCGMDMVFHTNYTIIHRLHRLGFITKDECSRLAQCTPNVI
jgi:hypothetical protein